MNGVVIRCSHCGTTQAALGECEACHEGETRYFCPNHSPGRWLDGPSCAGCGARLGVAPPRPAAPPPPPPRPATRPTRRTDALPRYDTSPPRRSRTAEDDPAHGARTGLGTEAGRHRSRSELFDALIRAAARGATSAPRSPLPPLPPLGSIASVAAKGIGLVGCLRRLVMLAIVLIVLAMVAFYLLFGEGGLLYRVGAVESRGARVEEMSSRAVHWRT